MDTATMAFIAVRIEMAQRPVVRSARLIQAEAAAVATAHLIARVYYRMLKDKVEYQPLSVEQYEAKYRQQQVRYLQKKAAKLGFQLVPA